jgi:hypothetical protein
MSKPTRRLSSSLLAGVTAATLFVGGLTPSPAHAQAAAKASVLSLEGDDAAKAASLSKALQSEFTRRGFTGGRDMSLAELKLTMGCDEPPTAACLASGGKTLGVDRMAYGTLTKGKGGGFTLNLNVMEVGSATVSQAVSVELTAAQLADGAVAATAKDVVVKVLGPEAETPPPGEPVVGGGPVEGPQVEDTPPPGKQGKWVWGKYDAPVWKKAGLGASAALTVVSLGLALGTYMQIRPGGPLKKDLIAAADASLEDEKPSNDINKMTGDDLCVLAREMPAGGAEGTVTNKSLTEICNKADRLATVSTVGWIATGVFLGATIVFTTLLFVHKRNPTAAALQRRGFSFGVTPGRGGFMAGTSFRF